MQCAISLTKDKSPLNLLFYKLPTSARNILIIVELGFSQFCLLCAFVRLWVELTCIRALSLLKKNKEENTVTYQESPPWLLTMFKTPCVETILYSEFSRSNRQENISGRTMDAGNHRLLLTSSGDAISEAFVEGRTHKFIVQRLNLK